MAIHLVLCNCGGKPFWTIPSDCQPPTRTIEGTVEPTVVATAGEKTPPPELVPYKLPSGTEVVGSHDQYLADNGTLVHRFISPVGDLKIQDGDQVICRLPSMLGVVESYANCKKNEGKVKGVLCSKLSEDKEPRLTKKDQ